jgi:hypothetical protein
MGLGNINKFEQFGPNPDLIRLTEKIVDQNNKIIEMNERLLALLSGIPVELVGDLNDKGFDLEATLAARQREARTYPDAVILKNKKRAKRST